MEKIKQKLFGLYPDYVVNREDWQKIKVNIIGEVIHEKLSDYLQLRSIDDLTKEESNCNELDYLRAIGIALPFGYLEDGEFKVMSVEEQVKNGWVVLEGKYILKK